MPGIDRKLDPATGDYIETDEGGWEETSTMETALYHQFNGEFNAWAGDAEAGCELYLLQRGRNSQAEAERAGDALNVAVRPFINLGLVEDLRIEIDREANAGRWAITTSLRDVQYGSIDLNPLLPFGG